MSGLTIITCFYFIGKHHRVHSCILYHVSYCFLATSHFDELDGSKSLTCPHESTGPTCPTRYPFPTLLRNHEPVSFCLRNPCVSSSLARGMLRSTGRRWRRRWSRGGRGRPSTSWPRRSGSAPTATAPPPPSCTRAAAGCWSPAARAATAMDRGRHLQSSTKTCCAGWVNDASC